MVLESVIIIVISGVIGLIIYQLLKDEDISLDRNMSDKIKELPEIYENAQNSIKMATDFDPEFFDNPKVKSSLKTAFECKVKIKIITEGKVLDYYEEIAEIKKIKKLEQHVMIIDGLHVRLEKPHCGRCFGEDKKDLAFIMKGFPCLSKKIEGAFDELWQLIPQA